MQEDLRGARFYVGLKQSRQAILDGSAGKAYVAQDADDHIKQPFILLCKENIVPISYIDTKEQLGKLCKIDVAAACAVVLR